MKREQEIENEKRKCDENHWWWAIKVHNSEAKRYKHVSAHENIHAWCLIISQANGLFLIIRPKGLSLKTF